MGEAELKKLTSLFLIILQICFIYPRFTEASESLPANETVKRHIVFFNEEVDESTIEQVGGKVIYKYDMINAASVELSPNQKQELKQSPKVKEVANDNTVEVSGQIAPWGHQNINLAKKNPANLSGKGIKIAILDSGVDTSHPDLKVNGGTCVLNLLYDSNLCKNSYNDGNGHGTHVAGIIAAKDNDIGIVGVAPNAEIYAIKALDAEGNGTTTTVMAGLKWAIENNMDIINMSLTTTKEDLGIKALIDKAYEKGILIVAAAGNSGNNAGNTDTVQYPAKFSNVIAVSAVNRNNVRIPTSSTGNTVELAAPGFEIYSTYPTNLASSGYAYLTGTSMAAPFVTGMAALYKEKYPTYSNIQIRKLLQENALDLGVPGKDPLYGYGLVQVDNVSTIDNDSVIKYQTNASGVINLNLEAVLETTGSYNLYRNGQLILKNGFAAAVTDYGTKGKIVYSVVPLINGIEKNDQALSLEVTLSSPYFIDLSNQHWYSRYLVYLNFKDVLKGYEDGAMKPDQQVTRAEAVAMLGRAKGLDGTMRPTKFKDVAPQSFASGYIQSAVDQGILTGFTDGTFKPDEPVTRAEMAIMLVKAYNLPKGAESVFKDVTESMAGYQEIHSLAQAAITQGYADGTFRPHEKMLRSTYAVFLAKADHESFR